MKTARIALLLVMMLILVACTQSQRRSAMSMAANTLLASLLDAQSNAPLTQSSFRPPRVVVAPEPAEANDDEGDVVEEPAVKPTTCPLAALPVASASLSDIAAHAAGVIDRMPARAFAIRAQQMAVASAKSAVIERCRYIRDAKGKQRIVVRAEITVPGDAIIIQGLDDFSL